MTLLLSGARIAALAAALAPAAGCQSLLPPKEGPSLLARQPLVDPGPSGQRRDADGFPLFGAYPNAATGQLTAEAVAADRSRLAAAATVQNAGAATSAADYDRRVAEMAAVGERQRADLAKASAKGGPATKTVIGSPEAAADDATN